MMTIQASAPVLSEELECRTFPSEFVELMGESASHHVCSFSTELAEYTCIVDNYYQYTYFYRSTQDFIDEARTLGLPRYYAIQHSMNGTLLLEEHLTFTDGYQVIHRSVRNPRAKLTIIDESITAWDDQNRPTRASADFDYGDNHPCTNQLLSFQYNEDERTVIKNYSGGEGNHCTDSTLLYQFDINGNLFTQLLSWHESEPIKIRRGDIMGIDTICQ